VTAPATPRAPATPAVPRGAPVPAALGFSARLSPPDASRYLAAVWAIRRTPKTLAKMRCASVGGGPAFQKCGRDVIYQRTALDAWANEMTREGGDG
jgi:hypothetical protein